MSELIAITGVGSISPLGSTWAEIDDRYSERSSQIELLTFDDRPTPAARLKPLQESLLEQCCRNDSRLVRVDRTVQLAVVAAAQAVRDADWGDRSSVGINIGSSRGATEMFERHYQGYLDHANNQVTPLASPSTTLGNISSWVGQTLDSGGIAFSHSMTCSSAMHAVANGIAWLRAGMADRFLVGGSEASLTGFTIAQMRALRLYAKEDSQYPCRPLASDPKNSVVLGEGAAMLAIEKLSRDDRRRVRAVIMGVGFATESIGTGTSMSSDAVCLQKSMQMAMTSVNGAKLVDAIIMHAPGTVRGDSAELAAVHQLFGNDPPMLLTNKWQLGHTFGASGALSIEFALHLLENQGLMVDFPYPVMVNNRQRPLHRIMINSTGFGGNAVSLIVERPPVGAFLD